MRTLAGAAVALVVLSACGEDTECKESYQDAGADPRAVCGVDIDEDTGQCFKPAQICPDEEALTYCQRVIGEPFRDEIILANAGQSPLKIESVRVLGDERCAFATELEVALGEEIPAGGSTLLRVTYQPDEEATDNIYIEVTSNAENFPRLVLSLCASGVQPGTIADECVPLTCQPPAIEEEFDCG